MDARHQSSDGRFGAKGWCGSLGLQRSANRRRSSYTHSAPELTATADIRAARTGISNAAPVGLSTGLSPSRLHRFGRFRPSRISECGEPSCYPKRYPKREWAAQERRNDLNYRFIWCRLQESNPRPDDYKSTALPTELSRRSDAAHCSAALEGEGNRRPTGRVQVASAHPASSCSATPRPPAARRVDQIPPPTHRSRASPNP